MNQDAITIIEADGLFLELLPMRPDGLYGPEQAALSTSFIFYAHRHGFDGKSLSSIRAAAKNKYRTKAERTGLVLQALNILLKQPKMDPYDEGIVEKAKTALEGQAREPSRRDSDFRGGRDRNRFSRGEGPGRVGSRMRRSPVARAVSALLRGVNRNAR